MDELDDEKPIDDSAILDDDILDDGEDDDLLLAKGKRGKIIHDDLLGDDSDDELSADALAEKEDELLPEDSFDDKDLW